MATKVNPIPAGYHTVTPYLIVKNCAKALDFYKRALNATEVVRMDGPEGRIMHAEIKIGDSHVMLSDEWPDMGILSPESRGGATSSIVLYLPDVDASFKQAISAGAKEQKPIQDQFWGDRMGTLVDPFGQVWSLATHVEDVSEEEMKKRMASMAA